MAGAGTGQPLIFGCSKCRRRWSAWKLSRFAPARPMPGTVDRVKLTGRKRKRRRSELAHTPTARTGREAREYRCLDCGHVGWSFHSDLELKERCKR